MGKATVGETGKVNGPGHRSEDDKPSSSNNQNKASSSRKRTEITIVELKLWSHKYNKNRTKDEDGWPNFLEESQLYN